VAGWGQTLWQYRGSPYRTNIFAPIARLSFIGFYITVFTHKEGEAAMEKKLVVIRQGKQDGNDLIAEITSSNGWNIETIELSKGEPLPRNFENIDGLLILSDAMNIFEESSSPLTVYMNS
jgi:hypothetical protein